MKGRPQILSAERWWVTSVWFWFAIVMNAFTAVFASLALIKHLHPSTPAWLWAYTGFVSIFQITCIVALMKFRRWGWYGLLMLGAITFFVNLANGARLWALTLGLTGVFIFFAVLKGGGPRAMWPRLK